MNMAVNPFPLSADSTGKESDKDSSLMPIWQCCSQDESEWLGSDVLITRNGPISSQSILGRYDKHFDIYPWYKGSRVFQDSRRVFMPDMEAIGFGFMTLDIPGVEDILKSTHIINGKKVAISRTIFIGDLPKTVNEDEFERFFSEFGKVVEHYIVRFSKTRKSAGFGFVIFDSDKDAADLAAMESIHFAGVVVKIKQAAFDKCTSPAIFDEHYARTLCGNLVSHSGGDSSDKESDSIGDEANKDSPLMPIWTCCFQDESEWLGSDVLITRNGEVSSQSILGRYDKHFDMYPWYKGSTASLHSRTGFMRDMEAMEAIGFSFMTLDIPEAEDILKSTHIINGKKVAISRTIFVGDLPKTVNEDEFEQFFSKFGNVVEHYIVHFSKTGKSAGFGFIIFDSDKHAAELAAMESIHFAGVAVKIKQAAFENCTSLALFELLEKNYALTSCGNLDNQFGCGSDLGNHFGGGSGADSADKESDSTKEESDKDSPLKPRWPCCSRDESRLSSQSILGRYDEHFDRYPWYKGSRVFQDSRCVFTLDMKTIGFGFMTLDIPGVDDILKSTHIINGKKVAISRTIFVGDLPKTVNEDKFKRFFSKFGKVVEHYIVGNSMTGKAAGFGFIIFDSDKDAADLAAMESINFAGVVVKIKLAAFKKCTSSAPFPWTFCGDLDNQFGSGGMRNLIM